MPVLALAVLAPRAHGSFEEMSQVAQPLLVRSGETAVRVCQVPYVGYGMNPRDRGRAIALTVAPNLVWCDRRAANRNLASIAGIGFELETGPDSLGGGMITILRDTLRIAVTIGTPQESLDAALAHILTATLWCGLMNARQAWPTVRYVEYSIEHENWKSLSGVYSLEELRSSAPNRWDKKSMDALNARRAGKD